MEIIELNDNATGLIRPLDPMGRVVIPKEFRKMLGMENDRDSFEIFMAGEVIILKKFIARCHFCGEFNKLVSYNGQLVCRDCIENLYSKRNEAN